MSHDLTADTATNPTAPPIVSVVIPVFNCERYVDAAIDSLVRQTFRGWECVCIDDGSTDASAARLDEWATRDGRIRVIHQANAGASAARNRGLDEARGVFLFFLDADDLLHPQAIDQLIRVADSEQADVVVGGLLMIDQNCLRLSSVLPVAPSLTTYDAPILPRLRSFRTFRFEAWGKLYARSCIGNARFPIDVECAEDTFFTLSVASTARRIAICPLPLYGYRSVPSSLSRNSASARKYIAGSVAVAIQCHQLCVSQNISVATANSLITIYGTNRILTEVLSAAADRTVTAKQFTELRSEAIAAIHMIQQRTGRGFGIVAPQHRTTWFFTAITPSRTVLSVLWQLRNLRKRTRSVGLTNKLPN